jgi:hypothetical protein
MVVIPAYCKVSVGHHRCLNTKINPKDVGDGPSLGKGIEKPTYNGHLCPIAIANVDPYPLRENASMAPYI